MGEVWSNLKRSDELSRGHLKDHRLFQSGLDACILNLW